MATTIDDFNYQKQMNKNQTQREIEKRTQPVAVEAYNQNNADTLTRKGYIDRGMNSIQYLANRRGVDRTKWDTELAQEQARYNNQLNVLKQEQGKYANNPGELARIDRQISALATEHRNNMNTISQRYIDEANGPSPKNKKLTAEEKKNLAQGTSNIASSLAGYFADKLAQQDEAPGAQNLHNQAALHDEQAAAEEANEQDSRQIANRDYREEAEKNAVAGAATENAQKVANLGNVSAGAAALARGVKSADYNTHMARQDEQREKAVQKQREAYGVRQTAEEERQAAEAENNDKRNMDIYNSLSRYLSMGGNNNVGNEDQANTDNKKEEAAATSGTMTAGTTPTGTTPPVTQQGGDTQTGGTGGEQQGGDTQTGGTGGEQQTGVTDEGGKDKDDGFISMPDTPPGTFFPWLWSLPGFMRNDNNKSDENKRLPPDGTPDELPSTDTQEELPAQEKPQELPSPENPEGLPAPQTPAPVIPPATGNQKQEPVPQPVTQPAPATQTTTTQTTATQTTAQPVEQPVVQSTTQPVEQPVVQSTAQPEPTPQTYPNTHLRVQPQVQQPVETTATQPAKQKDRTQLKENQIENATQNSNRLTDSLNLLGSKAFHNVTKYTGDEKLLNTARLLNQETAVLNRLPADEKIPADMANRLAELTKKFEDRWNELDLDSNLLTIHEMPGSGVSWNVNPNPLGAATGGALGTVGWLAALLGLVPSDARQKNIIAGCYKRF